MRVQMSTMKRYTAFLSVLLALFVLSVSASTVAAATYTVTNTNDDGAGSLRDAIAQANANAGADTIVFDTSGVFATPQTITLTSGELAISDDLTISGTGADKLTISGNNRADGFLIESGLVRLDGMTVANDRANVSGAGISISDVGILTITNSTITGNSSITVDPNPFASNGGGIYNYGGTLAIINSTISGNSAADYYGGGIYNDNGGRLTITNSTISGNSAKLGGGGIYNNSGGTLTITNSTISDNSAKLDGGGIYNNNGTLTITNSAVFGNSAVIGGGIFSNSNLTIINSTVSNNFANYGGGIGSDGPLTITNSTVAANHALLNGGGGGIFDQSSATLTLDSTIVADNLNGDIIHVSSSTVTASDSLIGDAGSSAGVVNGVNGNIVGADPKLGSLDDNGGPTLTHALLCGSPAIDKGENSNGLTTDQRGTSHVRTIDDPALANTADGTDIGAYELPTVFACIGAPIATDDSYLTDEDTALTFAAPGVLANDTDDENDPLTAVLVSEPSHGALSLNSDGSFNYKPDLNFNGSDSFTYKANDGSLDSNVATVTIAISPVNDDPVAQDDSFTATEWKRLGVSSPGVFANDTDADGDVLTGILVTPPTHADDFNFFPDGSFNYVTSIGLSDSFTYKVTDGHTESNVVTVLINVTPVNAPPSLIVDILDDDPAKSACTDAANDCSLRGAIADANGRPGLDDIAFDTAGVFATPQTITLGGTALQINDDLTINGTGAGNLTISGNNASRVFSIGGEPTVTLSGMTVSNGHGETGAGIFNGGGTLYIENSTVSNNAVDTTNAANINGGLSAYGSIYNAGWLYIKNSTVSGNSAISGGANAYGGIYNHGTLNIENSTVSNNIAISNAVVVCCESGNGFPTPKILLGEAYGGIYNQSTLYVGNSTVSNNTASFDGAQAGGIYNNNNSTLYLNSSILASNTTNGSPSDLKGAVSSGDYNLVRDISGVNGALPGTHNITGVDPMLGPLAYSGGPTMTHAPLCGSPAIDAGKNFGGLSTDQRGNGFSRIFDDQTADNAADGDGTDIGAFELQEPLACNTAPVANDDSYSTNEATPFSGKNVLANDTDGENDTLTATLVAGPANGDLTFNADGSLTYAPNANFNGTDSFTYKANDGKLDSNVATVTITVNWVNSAPVAVADSYTVTEEIRNGVEAPGVLGNDTDADNDPLTAILVSGPSHAGDFHFFPDGSFNYATSGELPDSFTYKVSDGFAESNTVTVLINVIPVNDPPTLSVKPSLVSIPTLRISTFQAIGGDEETPNALTYSLVGAPVGAAIDPVSGEFTWAPTAAQGGGISYQFQVCVSDGEASTCLPVDITVNDAGSPTVVAIDASNTGWYSPDFGHFGYNPNYLVGSIDGSNYRNYFVFDLDVGSQTGVITGAHITVQNAERVSRGVPYTLYDVNTPIDTLVVSSPPNPTIFSDLGSGSVLGSTTATDQSPVTVELNANGVGLVQQNINTKLAFGGDYPVPAGNEGYLFYFSGNGERVPQLFIEFQTNTAPVAKDDGYSTSEDTTLNFPATGVLGNDTDNESDPLTVALISGPSHAQSFTFNTDGSFTYTPNANFNGTDSFTYKANDGKLDSNVATVTITVNPVNDAPVVSATPKTQSSAYSDAISTVTINASDVETPASALTIALSYSKDGAASVAGLPAGMVQGGTAGSWTVLGVAGVPQGTYVITATVTDTGDGSAAAVSSSDSFTIAVTREKAVAAPRSTNPVSMQVASAGGTASGTTGQICFDITEPADGSAGDTSLITAATIQINTVGGGSGSGTITPSAVTFSGGGVGTARTACFTLTLAGTPVNVYEVELVIGGNFYTGSGTTVFTVFDPSSGFASGGGWITNPNNGNRANYGVNVKYLKNGNYQGSVLYVEHRPDGDYKVKSTSLNSTGGFAIIPITGGSEADIAGKANYGVNDVLTGNYSFIARIIDKGTPGTNDQFGLKLINPSGQIVADLTFNPVTLSGGNNQVPKK